MMGMADTALNSEPWCTFKQIGIVVGEKELGLKQALRTMGMTDSAYWLSWAAWELTLAFITGHLICIFGVCGGGPRCRERTGLSVLHSCACSSRAFVTGQLLLWGTDYLR